MLSAATLATAVAAGTASAQVPAPGAQPVGAEAAARVPARVLLRELGCGPAIFDAPLFIKLLRIELTTDGVSEVLLRDPAARSAPEGEEATSSAANDALAVLTVERGCEADGQIVINIDDAATDKRVRRTVDIGAVAPEGRARVLALATAELLRASWAELALAERPPSRAAVPARVERAVMARLQRSLPPAAAPMSADAGPQRERTREDALLLVFSPETRFYFREHLGIAGLRLGPSLALPRSPLRLRLHAASGLGAGGRGGERYTAWVVTSGVGLTAVGRMRSAALELGPHLEVGWGWRRSQSEERPLRDGADGVLGALSLVASGRVHLSGAWWAVADLEVGQALASSAGTTEVGGATAAARLGFALAP